MDSQPVSPEIAMPRHQIHRGPAPRDDRLFAARQLPALRAAAHDLYWLLDHGYAARSAVELVGNRYTLTSRQRMAVARCACSREETLRRSRNCIEPTSLNGRELWIDGYNVITVLESALAGGVVLLGRDGCYRDIAGIHRRYRKVNETLPVLRMIREFAATCGVSCCRWWLDKPVSNSGRLKGLILDAAAAESWNVQVDLTFNPDGVLAASPHIVATSDSAILDRCRHWANLTGELIKLIPNVRLIDLSSNEIRVTS
jgi:hypothetical protein